MIKGKLLLCAEGVSIDKQSNNATIFNIIEQLNLKHLPVVFPKMVIFSVFERDDGDPETWDGEFSICIDGSEAARDALPINFQGQKVTRTILTVAGLPITQPGKMEISIYEKGGKTRKMLSYSIGVIVPTQAVVEPSEQSG
jgi:hypothetical protein